MSSSDEENNYSSGDDEDYVPDAHHSSEEETVEKSIVDNGANGIDKKDDDGQLGETLQVDEIWNRFKKDTMKCENDKKDSCELNALAKASKKDCHENKCDLGKTSDNGSAMQNSELQSSSAKDTITITKVYDFAGEKVEVTKEVKADSKEAQNHFKQQSATSSTGRSSNTGLLKRRPGGGIGNVLGKLGKKPKLSTLEKSKLDWDNFKSEEGIEDELQSYKKGREGYLEKVSFLERTDMRQFEREREMRLGRMSKR